MIDLPLYKLSWLIQELSKNDNQLAVKNKYKRIYNETLSDSILEHVVEFYKEDIKRLKELSKLDIDNHPYSSEWKRMEELSDIVDLAKQGTIIQDKQGNIHYKTDLGAAIAAIKAMGEIKQNIANNELKLLQILIQSDRLKLKEQESPIEIQETAADDIKQITTDNDQYFIDD